MKHLIKKILKESEDDFSWVTKPDVDSVEELRRYLALLLYENGFQLHPEYGASIRYYAIRDKYMGGGYSGQLYYAFPDNRFSKEYLKDKLDEHNRKYPTPDNLPYITEKRQHMYDKYKKIEQIIRSVIE